MDAFLASLLYLVLLLLFWSLVSHSQLSGLLGGAFAAIFLSFALILAPLIGFGFGAAEWLARALSSTCRQVAFACVFVVPYLISAAAARDFSWKDAAAFLIVPISLTALFAFPRGGTRSEVHLDWRDAVAFLALACPIVFHWFRNAWPWPGLSGMPKLLLTDVALYAYLVVRRLPGVGYDFRAQVSDFAIGIREWILFAPVAIGLGFALRFLHLHTRVPPLWTLLGGLGFTLIFIAIPEELFFRGLLMNLLQTRWSPTAALLVSSVLFGLSHFNKGALFNWRYVLLATLAGIFYGRAWRHQRRILASALTHALVDVTWSLWFR